MQATHPNTNTFSSHASLLRLTDTHAYLFCLLIDLPQSVTRESVESSSVSLGALVGWSQSQLGGFRMRAVRAETPSQRHMYSTSWMSVDAKKTPIRQSTTLAISNDDSAGENHLAARSTLEELTAEARSRKWSTLVAYAAMHRGTFAVLPLFVLEGALTLVHSIMGATSVMTVVLMTAGAQAASQPAHAGSWGLARSARAEASLSVLCMDAAAGAAHTLAPTIDEPEVVVYRDTKRLPRLATAPSLLAGLVRLDFHARGAISNLFLESQSKPQLLSNKEVLLQVHAVGLNFRDVLNVLGEYPGDPGPPGGDSSGVTVSGLEVAVFGLGQAPLACVAVAIQALLVRKSSALTFEQASTLPVTWSTTHTALQRAELCANRSIIAQAAAGGVGLKATEYAQWLSAPTIGTAGRPHKHTVVNQMGMRTMCSSRDSAAFATGLMRQLSANRAYAVFNSLSLDFIAASFASLNECGAFEEIGKRGVWSYERYSSSVSGPSASYCAIALDADMVLDPAWMHDTLALLAARTSTGAVSALPLDSFDMETQYEKAFRTLQSGLNLGKVVMRVAPRESLPDGSHVVTGGTGGLGLLTARWLAQRGARNLVLASRSGVVAGDVAAEWQLVEASAANVTLEKCDTSDVKHVRRLVAFAPQPLQGLWHAAGALADAVLQKQTASGLALVYAPKAHGTWNLHASTITSGVHACALFSSVVAMLGGAGQANYGAANTCLDALASSRRLRGTAATSVQWGAWAEIGMAARGAASTRMAAMAAASGFGRVALAQGLAALSTATRQISSAVMGVVPIVWSRFLSGGTTPAFLSEFALRKHAPGRGSSVGAVCGLSLASVLEMVKRTAGGVVDADAPLMEAGVDSLGAVELRNQLQGTVGSSTALPSTLVFDHPTARQLSSVLEPKLGAKALARVQHGSSSSLAARHAASMEGVSAVLPAGAQSMQGAQKMISCGTDAISEVPASRWNVHMQPALPELVASRVRHLGVVQGAELSDNALFGVSPSEASAMDPCQRLVLEHGYAALNDTALDRAALSGSLTGVFLGFAGTGFDLVLAASPAGGSVYAATGASLSIASGRVSYVLGLNGPCVSYDTACSAALAASHAGLRALQLSECSAAVVVGTTLMLMPVIGTTFAVAGMTSPHGRCHTFDSGADGYARGEATGAAVLSADGGEARELLGSAVRQDGRSASLTAPSGQAQGGLITAALADAGSSADEIVLHEAHGTGTALGDPIEAGSLVAAMLSSRGDQTSPVPVGGVKANIGHAEPAAGMTGLLKLAAGMLKKVSAANAQLRALNPMVSSAFRDVSCSLAVQPGGLAGDAPAHGGVSSFGYSGTIVHSLISFTCLSRTGNWNGSQAQRRREFGWSSSSLGAAGRSRVCTYNSCWTAKHLPSNSPPFRFLIVAVRSSDSQDKLSVDTSDSEAARISHDAAIVLAGDASGSPARHGIQLLIGIAQQLVGSAEASRLLVITQGAMQSSGSSASSAHGGAWGFGRVLRVEQPTVRSQSTDASGVSSMLSALADHSPDPETVLCGQMRLFGRLRACPAGSKLEGACVHGRHVITGGLGGLGLCAASLLCEAGSSEVCLLASHLDLVARLDLASHLDLCPASQPYLCDLCIIGSSIVAQRTRRSRWPRVDVSAA